MIGYYVHHHGTGHLQRMLALTAHLREPVTVLSSLTPPAAAVGRPWVVLPRDDGDAPVHDPRAHGTLHWVPAGHPGLRARMAALSAWIAEARPTLLVVDVSVEVTLLARLHGVPVVVVAMPGQRTDPAHRLGYDVAESLLAPWPAELCPVDWPPPWRAKAACVGAFSRFDGRPVPERPPADPSRGAARRVLLLWGAGGSDVGAADVERARAATPGWEWTVRMPVPGAPPAPTDVWDDLQAADVVVAHAGQNVVAEVATARRPAVLLPQRRPFGEQHATARTLAGAGIAVTEEAWPAPERWPGVLDDAARLGGRGWARWHDGAGAARAAAHVDAECTRLRAR